MNSGSKIKNRCVMCDKEFPTFIRSQAYCTRECRASAYATERVRAGKGLIRRANAPKTNRSKSGCANESKINVRDCGGANAMAPVIIEIQVGEVVQAGDVFLFHFPCPHCAGAIFSGFPCTTCPHCRADLAGCGFKIPKDRKKRRLVAGSVRKNLVTKRTVRVLLECQEKKCAYCCSALTKYHIDHIVPVSVGGTNTLENLCLACPDCNLSAGAWVFPDFNGKRAFILNRRLEQKRKRESDRAPQKGGIRGFR